MPAPAGPGRRTRVWGSPPPGPPTLPLRSWHPPPRTGEDGPPHRPHLSPRARRGAALRGGGGRAAGGRHPPPWTPARSRAEAAADPPWAQPADSGPGKQESPAGWPSPRSPPPSRVAAHHFPSGSHLPSGPFKNGTAAASLPVPTPGRATPTGRRGPEGRHVTADGGRRGSKLAGRERSPISSCLTVIGQPCQKALFNIQDRYNSIQLNSVFCISVSQLKHIGMRAQ